MARSERSGWRRAPFVTACVAAVPFVLACNGIIGLSDYGRAECSGGGVCPDAGSDVSIRETGTPDTSTLPVLDAAGTTPVRWVNFVMPNYPQDGGPEQNVPSYEVGQGQIVDPVSKLVWREPMAVADRGPKTWAEAERICAGLSADGGWRVPTRIELVSLLDLSRKPAISPVFATAEALEHWTSSEVRVPGQVDVAEHWTVDFDTGGVGKRNASKEKAAVRCIKAR